MNPITTTVAVNWSLFQRTQESPKGNLGLDLFINKNQHYFSTLIEQCQ
jgi:hypothetical protein